MTAATVDTRPEPARSRWTAARKSLTVARRHVADAAAATQARVWSLRQAVLGVAGLACIDGSAFQVNTGTGLLVTGGSLLLLGWIGEDDDD